MDLSDLLMNIDIDEEVTLTVTPKAMTPLFVYPYICEFVMYGFCTMDVWNT
jgi:hypothetical protein